MLQQTSVERVRLKYRQFLRAFPSLGRLAEASVEDVLIAWKGLGYNRRALALRESARIMRTRFGGRVPRTVEELSALPGIGHATASAILVYAFDEPHAFIETNIRRVFIHFFFPGRSDVRDADILPLVERTMDRSNPREWFYGLMDYGELLARSGRNPNLRSAHYKRQAPFQGSIRQVRGRVLEAMLEMRSATGKQIVRALGGEDPRVPAVLDRLVEEGFLILRGGRYSFR